MGFLARVTFAVACAVAAQSATSLVHADNGPVIVIPSRPGVPIVINGRDASWAVVEGDWGLSRPGHMAPNVIGGRPLPYGHIRPRQGGYYPRYGTAPERGRHEMDLGADRPVPDSTESYHRSWSTQSAPAMPVSDGEEARGRPSYNSALDPPATIPDPQAYTPPLVVAPVLGRRRP